MHIFMNLKLHYLLLLDNGNTQKKDYLFFLKRLSLERVNNAVNTVFTNTIK
jgi:hypothetical protein